MGRLKFFQYTMIGEPRLVATEVEPPKRVREFYEKLYENNATISDRNKEEGKTR